MTLSLVREGSKRGSGMKYDLLTFGEILLRLSPVGGSRLKSEGMLRKDGGGAELNVAAGAAQLGLCTAVCSKLPDNALTDFILAQAASLGVASEVLRDSSPTARLGTYYFEPASAPRKPAVVYDRKFSSMTTLQTKELDFNALCDTRMLHVSGITLGLGEPVRSATIALMKAAKEAGVLLSFDINYRANLWTDQEERAVVEPLLPLFDVLFISEESFRRMFGQWGELVELQQKFARKYGLSYVLSTSREALTPSHHTFTSTVFSAKEEAVFTEPPYEIDVVDRIGSGDAFVAGALAGILQTDSGETAMRMGNAMAAVKCTIPGDLTVTAAREIQKIMDQHREQSTSEMDR